MLGLGLAAHPFSGVRLAVEVMWWVEPEARGRGRALWRAGERWAAEAGRDRDPDGGSRGHGGRPGGAALSAPRLPRRSKRPTRRPVTPAMSALTVVDDVLAGCRRLSRPGLRATLRRRAPAPGVVFHGIAPAPDDALPAWIAARWPGLTPTRSVLRQSPAGQVEPTFIHTDDDMGDWTAIAYLTADPPPDDGTTFWRQTATGVVTSASPLAADRRVRRPHAVGAVDDGAG